jgi:hypothetical protein
MNPSIASSKTKTVPASNASITSLPSKLSLISETKHLRGRSAGRATDDALAEEDRLPLSIYGQRRYQFRRGMQTWIAPWGRFKTLRRHA